MEPQVTRTAVIAYHSSPLGEPGTGDSGGMTIYVRELAAACARQGVSTDVFTRSVGRHPRVVVVAPGVRVISIDAGPVSPLPKEELPCFIEDFVTGARAFATTQCIRYDAVHSHYWQSGLGAISLARAWEVPLVHSQHTLARVKNSFLAPGEAPEPQIRIDGELTVIREADVLLASTDEEWRQLSCLYGAPHDRLKTLHPGVDHAVFNPGDRAAARAALGLEDDARVLLYVGRIQPLKGLELAVRSVRHLLDDLGGRLTFLVVGGASGRAGEPEIERIRSLVGSLGLKDVVRFVGPRRHAELPDFYRAADVLTMCSHSESFGLAALEAHACGTPVVGTAVGGLSHIVGDGVSGWLIDTRDPIAFSKSIRSLLSDRELWKESSANALRSAMRFSWTTSATALVELYECLARERSPQACTC